MAISVESPFPESSVPRIWHWMREFRSRVADDFAPTSLDAFMELWRAQSAAGQRSWAVFRDGELGGMVTFAPQSPVVGITHCLFKRSFWGHETTVPALRLVYGEIFASGTNKVCSLAFKDNVQILHMCRVLGGDKEGVLREHTMRGGALVDMMIISLTRTQFEAAQVQAKEVAA